jgi:hypothetical protein
MINYYVINTLEIADTDNYTSSTICKEESIVVGYNIEFDYSIIFCRGGYLKKYLSESFIKRVFNVADHGHGFHSKNKLTEDQIKDQISSIFMEFSYFTISSEDLTHSIKRVRIHQEEINYGRKI